MVLIFISLEENSSSKVFLFYSSSFNGKVVVPRKGKCSLSFSDCCIINITEQSN